MTKLQSRYPGTRPFETEQQLIFKGRQEDTRALFQKIQLEYLVVLYGKSGTGKSSLLNAGLIPKVKSETDWLPVRVRFNAWSEDPGHATPVDSARFSVRGGHTAQPTFLDWFLSNEASLWHDVKEHFIRHEGQKGLLLVIDQFEELFTYPAEQVAAFGEQLAEAMFKAVPQRYWDVLQGAYARNEHPLNSAELALFQHTPMLKVVLSIRSDRVHLLNRLEQQLPVILKHLYELDALSPASARLAIAEPAAMPHMDLFDTEPFLFEETAIGNILDFLIQGNDGNAQKIEATQLQIICSVVEKRVKAGNLQMVTPAQVSDLGNIIEQYYEVQINDLPTDEQLPARRLIEEGLVFEEEERRLSLYEGQILKTYNILPETLRRLVDGHFLRAEPSLTGGYTYELSHDTLVAPVLKAKSIRLEAERRAVEASFVAQRAAELAEARAEAAREKRRRRRAAMLAWFTALAAVFALVAAVFAGQKMREAEAATRSAESALSAALNAQISRYDTEIEAGRRKIEVYKKADEPELVALETARLDTLAAQRESARTQLQNLKTQ